MDPRRQQRPQIPKRSYASDRGSGAQPNTLHTHTHHKRVYPSSTNVDAYVPPPPYTRATVSPQGSVFMQITQTTSSAWTRTSSGCQITNQTRVGRRREMVHTQSPSE